MRTVLSPLLAALALIPPAHAEEPAALPALEVAATRLTPAPVGSPVYVIEREDIARSTARNIGELLASVPGVTIRQLSGNAGSEGTVDLRGFGAAASVNTLILVDGRRLNDVDLESTNIGGLPLAAIERIEVQPGGGSVLYGDGASGGTVNIVTRRATQSGGSVSAAVGSYATREGTVTAQLAGEKIALGLFGQHVETDGYRDNSELRRENGGLDLRATFGVHEFYVLAQTSRLDSRLPGVRTADPAIGLDELHNDPRGTNTPNTWADEERTQTVVGWKNRITDRLTLIVDGSQRYKHQWSFYDPPCAVFCVSTYTDTALGTLSLTPRLLLDYETGPFTHHVQTGYDWYRSDYTSKRGLVEGSAPRHIVGIDSESESPYLFQTTRWQKTALSLGARQTRLQQAGRDLFEPTAPGSAFDTTSAAPGNQGHQEEMYEAGLSQELTEGLTAMVGASRSVRFGTLDETYENDPLTFARVFSPLRPQIGRNVEASLAYVRRGHRITLTTYRQKLRDEIAYDPVNGTNDNLDPTQRKGSTLALTSPLLDSLTLNASLTEQRARFRSGAIRGNTVPVVPERLGYVDLRWQFLPSWNFTVSDTYTGSKYFDNDQANRFGQKIPAYHRVDVRLGTKWKMLSAGFAVHNATDEDDSYDYGAANIFSPGRYNAYPLPDRNYRFEVAADF
jgi:iron complex outermembrane receptor protein